MSKEQILKAGYPFANADDLAKVPLSKARAAFTGLVNLAADEGQRAMIIRHNEPVAAIVPIYDLKRLMDADVEVRGRMEVENHEGQELLDFDTQDDDQSDAEQNRIAAVGKLVLTLMEDPKIREFLDERHKAEEEDRSPELVQKAFHASNDKEEHCSSMAE